MFIKVNGSLRGGDLFIGWLRIYSVKEAYRDKTPKDDSATPEATTSASAMGFTHTELHNLDDKGQGIIHNAIINGKKMLILN